MTCESSLEYYRIINETVRAQRGGHHSAQIIMVSVDFAEISDLMDKEKWDDITKILISISKKLENGGADFIVICTNTMHKLVHQIQAQITIPILHIVDVTAEKIRSLGLRKIGLLGTKTTMEEDFYKGRLTKKYHLKVIIPPPKDREIVHNIILKELSIGEIRDFSKEQYWNIINALAAQGAEGIILGCTEIGLLVQNKGNKIPLFDTTKIHAEAAAIHSIT